MIKNMGSSKLFSLSSIELLERFAFFGLRSLLILYLTQYLKMDDIASFHLYASFMALTYATSLGGGVIADSILGQKRAILIGAILMALGYAFLCHLSLGSLYTGLTFIIVGSGLFKPSIMTLFSHQYKMGGSERETAFTIFYTFINIAGVLAPLICGYVGQVYSWRLGFSVALGGITACILLFLTQYNTFEEQAKDNLSFKIKGVEVSSKVLPTLSIGFGLITIYYLLTNPLWIDSLMPLLGIVMLISFGIVFRKSHKEQRKNLYLIFIIMISSVCFFGLYEQGGSSISLFCERNVDRFIAGFQVSTSQLQALMPFLVIFLGPLLAAVWYYLGAHKCEILPTFKIGLGFLCLGIGFGWLIFGTHLNTNTGKISLNWIIVSMIFQVIGELLVSPVGLSTITRLAPSTMTSLFVSFWFIIISFGHYIAGYIARFAALSTTENSPLGTILLYQDAFLKMALIALGLGLSVLIINWYLNLKSIKI